MKPEVKKWTAAIIALLEKAAATWVQAFIVALVGSTFFETLDLSVAASAAVATVPAMITVLLAAVQSAKEPSDWPLGQLILWRSVRTAGAMFLGTLAGAQWVLDLGGLRAIGAAAVAAAGGAFLAAIKGGLATLVGDPGSPALLSAHLDLAA